MTITPDVALELTDEQITVIAEVQSEVDAYLADNYIDGRQIDIRGALLVPLFSYGEKVLNAFIDSYADAGWTVIKYTDSRQGDWLSFSRT